MNIQGKVWGKTQNLFNKNNVEIHRIKTKQGGFCSKHRHKHKYNMFYVESGKIEIEVWKNNYNLIDKTIISEGELTTVLPMEYHRFRSLEDSIVYEIYWVELCENDIDREDVGGK